jgi:hypothetical protein
MASPATSTRGTTGSSEARCAWTGVPLWGRLFYLLARQLPGGHRDWPAIEKWADEVAEALAPFTPGTASR